MFPDLTRDDVFRLETRRLWLRWPRHADSQAMVRLAGEKAVAEMTAHVPHPYPPEEAARFVLAARKANAEGRGLDLAVTPKRNPNGLVGMVGIREGEDGPHLGYWIGSPSWGQGFATEGARALLDHAFGTVGLSRIWAETMSVNHGSRGVLGKLGFRLIHMYVGTWDDPLPGWERGELVYEITRPEWRSPAARRDPA